MRLSTRLNLVLAAGTACALCAAAAVQSWLLARQTRVHAGVDAHAIVEELQRALEMTQGELERSQASLAALAADRGRAGVMQRLQTAAPGVVLVASDGSVLAGALDGAALADWLQAWLSARGQTPASGVVQTPAGPRVVHAGALADGGDRLVQLAPLPLDGLRQGRVGVTIELVPALDGAVAASERSVFSRLFRGTESVSEVAREAVTVFHRLADPSGAPVYIARVRAERLGGALQRAWLRDTLAWMAALALGGALLMRRFLKGAVVEPLEALRQHATRIGRSDHGRVEIRLARVDEFGDLAQALNDMLRTLERTRKELRTARDTSGWRTSRRASSTAWATSSRA